ncbi:MAG: hypothetical protein AB7G15_16130, partial [Alphaproteobacteria bacterium]
GVAAFVGWYNAHPDFRDLNPDLNTRSVVVIGVGNVAVDVARELTKTPEEMAATDLADHAAQMIHAAPITDVYMVGRRGPLEARFTNVELREMGHLKDAVPVLDAAQLPTEVTGEFSERDRRLVEKNLATLREFTQIKPAQHRKRVHFTFYASPVEILGGERVTGVRFERTRVEKGNAIGTGAFFEIPCGLVIPAIGYYSDPIEGVPFDRKKGKAATEDGRIEPGLYAVGWIKRGPSGVIGSNKPDGEAAADQIAADFKDGTKTGRAALDTLLAGRKLRAVSFPDWKRIEAAEVAAAHPGAPRRKFARIADMLKQLG